MQAREFREAWKVRKRWERELNEHLSDQDRYNDEENRRCDCIGNCENLSSFFFFKNE